MIRNSVDALDDDFCGFTEENTVLLRQYGSEEIKLYCSIVTVYYGFERKKKNRYLLEESKDKKQTELDPSEWTIIQYF